MTFSATLKIIVACFAVAALVATSMSGSESAGLKGSSRKLQFTPSDVTSRSFGIINSINPASFVPATVSSITPNSAGILATLNPPPPVKAIVPEVPVGPVTIITNTVLTQSAAILKGLNP
jgi:hypothetical protein